MRQFRTRARARAVSFGCTGDGSLLRQIGKLTLPFCGVAGAKDRIRKIRKCGEVRQVLGVCLVVVGASARMISCAAVLLFVMSAKWLFRVDQ